jgi:hypothetical protein
VDFFYFFITKPSKLSKHDTKKQTMAPNWDAIATPPFGD